MHKNKKVSQSAKYLVGTLKESLTTDKHVI